MNKIKRQVLCSFDDGNQLDLQLADLLLKYEIPSVFYIPANCDLTKNQIERLARIGSCSLCPKMRKLFDIGSHSMTHLKLTELTESQAMKEIAGSKAFLENIIKRPVTRFCYPFGQYNKKIKEMVKAAGYKSARTTRLMSTDFPKDPHETKISICVYPNVTAYRGDTWLEVGYRLFDKVIEKGGRFELYAHSWEIEKYNMWEFLEDFLWYMDEKMKEIKYPREI